jgi:nucleoside-diphosphate-sugar epimerase
VAKLAADQGATVRSLVRSRSVGAGEVSLGGEVFLGDLKAGGWPDAAFDGADVVVHCAASLGGPLAHQRAVNRDGTALVAAKAAAAGVARFVHVSSVAVYGYQGTYFPETQPLRPSTQAYATTKAEAEDAARQAFPGVTIIRPGGLFGPGARFWSVNFVRRSKRRLAFNIGRGAGTLPVIAVFDAAALIAAAATHPAAVGEAFNCCLDPAPTWREYQAAYGALVGRDRWIPLPVSPAKVLAAVVARFGRRGTNTAVLDELLRFALTPKRYPMDKARSLLGWEPFHDLHAAVAATAPWLRRQGHI